jgi:hypothetical protein
MQLPWTSNHKGLGSTYHQTLYRFQQLEIQLQHQPDTQKNHADFMKEYKQPGHMQLVPGGNGKVTFYCLPHHLVFKHNSSTTKLKKSLMGVQKALTGTP